MADENEKLEAFVRWFLRFNGYFSIENFVVHAADDPARISSGMVAPHTEMDTLAVRMPYSHEVSGALHIDNFKPLVNGSYGRFDVVIAEAKSGDAKPNAIWKVSEERSRNAAAYIARFIGLHGADEELNKIARDLVERYSYEDERVRYRFVIFSTTANEHYQEKGVTYITLEDVARFLVEVRGQCWIEENIGVASIHNQWNPLINRVFAIANDQSVATDARSSLVSTILSNLS